MQFCTNSAFIVGMPFVNVHSHLREYVNGAYPVITNHYDITNAGNTTVYPDAANGDVANREGTKLKYFQNHWEDLSWLRAINSMILPSDNSSIMMKSTLLEQNMHQFLGDGSRLKLIGKGIASPDSKYEISRFHDDDVYAYKEAANSGIEQYRENGSINPNWTSVQTAIENYSTAALKGSFTDLDFISPLTSVIAIPRIYYGNRIHPSSIELKFKLNEGRKEIIIKDHIGTLYRFDPVSNVRTTKVGHVDYGTGVLCLLSPLLTSIGIDNFDIKFRGEKNMHILQLDIPCASGVGNISQNPTYPTKLDTLETSDTYNQQIPKTLKPTSNASETDGKMTYISTIYLHDENLNIIGKVNLAQPVQKREEDSYVFRVKVDF